MLAAFIFLLNFSVTWFLVGLIWFLQVVHYPLFKAAATEKDFGIYEKAHTPLALQVIFPAMVLEMVTATLLVMAPLRPHLMSGGEALFGLLLVAGVWISTTFLVAPAHQHLAK